MREHSALRTFNLQIPTHPQDILIQQRQLTIQALQMADVAPNRSKRQDRAKVGHLRRIKRKSEGAEVKRGA